MHGIKNFQIWGWRGDDSNLQQNFKIEGIFFARN